MSEIDKLNENELNDVAGGKSHSESKKAHRVGKCNQCAIEGNMNSNLYSINGMQFCRDAGHIYKNGSYAYTNKAEIAGIKVE